LRGPKFHLLTFFDGQNKPQNLVEELRKNYFDLVDFHELPLYPNIAEIFGTDKSFSVLLRPDNYIGTISSDVSFETVENYVNRIFSKAET
jgi:hypothetical protein